MKTAIVVGAGLAGITAAQKLSDDGYQVELLEERPHIGGNVYDFKSNAGILNQKYGAHIFHTKSRTVMEYLKKYSDFFEYRHKVLGEIDGKLVPIPFNLQSLSLLFPEKEAAIIRELLLQSYGYGAKIPISDLRKNINCEIQKLADFIYEKVFLHYTEKQWQMKLEELDPDVGARVPVVISDETGYFDDEYQCMPIQGFTEMCNRMLQSPLIHTTLACDALDLISMDASGNMYFKGEKCECPVIYTGCLDRLFRYQLGTLPYRSLDFEYVELPKGEYQSIGVINYPNEHRYTRIIEFKHFTGKYDNQSTDIAYEYPCNFDDGKIPYYPVPQKKNRDLYDKYAKRAQAYPNLILLGRLAEYKYYNMDQVISSALKTISQLLGRR